jgi:4-amino-4-deoxy-L-arabinose transferase-like glycosyltransferase
LGGLFFFRLGQDVPLRSHEALLAVTARNMVLDRPVEQPDGPARRSLGEGGSRPNPYLVPNFNGSDRLKKTPLGYWTVAGLAHLTGRVDEWTARLPSAAAALGAVLIVMALVRRQADRRTALLAVAALATCAQFLVSSREAVADMLMVMLVTASLASLWMGVERRGSRRFGWLVLSGAAGGLAMLAKGPVPLVVLPAPLVAAVIIVVVRLWRDGREGSGGPSRASGSSDRSEWAWAFGGAVAAIAVFLAIVTPWLVLVPEAWATLWSESVERSLGELGHKKGESVFFYLLRLPVLVAPWTIFFAWGLVLAVQRWRREAAARPWLFFLGAWFVGPLVAFSVAAGKQDHYILPILPPVAIFIAMAMRRLLAPDGPAARAGRWLMFGHGAAAVLFGIGGVAIAALLRGDGAAGGPGFLHLLVPLGPVPIGILGGIGAVGGAATCALAIRRRLIGSLAALTATVAVAFLWAWPAVVGPMDRASTAADFCREVRREVASDQALFAFEGANATAVYYMERDLPVLPDREAVEKAMAAGRPFFLIVAEKNRAALGEVRGLEPVVEKQDPFRPHEGYRLFEWRGGPPAAASP